MPHHKIIHSTIDCELIADPGYLQEGWLGDVYYCDVCEMVCLPYEIHEELYVKDLGYDIGDAKFSIWNLNDQVHN